MHRSFVLLILVLVCAPGARRGHAEDAAIHLQGGSVVTMSDAGTIRTDILIRDGKIAALGLDLDAGDARSVDIAGMTVTPGWIDCRSQLWLTAGAAREGAADGGLDIHDGIDPFSEDWKSVARQGVTTVYVQPAARGTLGGSGAVLRVAPASSIEALVIAAPAGMQAALGVVGSSSRTSRARASQYERIKKAFAAAKKYGEQWEKYEKYQKEQAEKEAKQDASKKKDSKNSQKAREAGGSKEADEDKQDEDKKDAEQKQGVQEKEKDKKNDEQEEPKPAEKSGSAKGAADKSTGKKDEKPPEKPKRDPAKEQLLKVLRGEIPLRLEAHRQDEIQHAAKLAEEFELRLVLDGVSQPGDALSLLQRERIPLVLGPAVVHDSAAKLQPLVSVTGAALLKHDPLWALATFANDGRSSRMLRLHASRAVAHGLDPADVLAAVTRDAATLLGIGDERGAVIVGHAADLTVFAGDPLDTSVPVRLTLSNGEVTYEADVAYRGEESEPGAARTSGEPYEVARKLDVPSRLPPHFALRSQRVLQDDGHLAPATVVVGRGRIVEVATSDAQEKLAFEGPLVDLGEAVVTPGLFLARSSLGAVAVSDTSEPAIPEVIAADAFQPSRPRLDELILSGILRLGITPSQRNVLAGQVALARLSDEPSILQRAAAMQMVLSNASRLSERYPASLSGQDELVRRWVGSGDVDTSLHLPAFLTASLLQQRKASMSSVRSGDLVAWMDVETRAELHVALGLQRDLKLKTVLVEPRELELLVERDLNEITGLIASPVEASDYDRQLELLVEVLNKKVPVAFAGDNAAEIRATASLAVAAGWPAEHALLALTHSGLAAAGFETKEGRLHAGAHADLVIWTGSPLDLQSRVHTVLVAGRVYLPSTD